MKLRMLAAIAVAPLVLAALAGCAAPVHKVSAAARCTPTTATIQWGTPSAPIGALVPVQVTILDFSKGDGSWTSTSTNIESVPLANFSQPSLLTRTTKTPAAKWQKTLVQGLLTSGKVSPGFGVKVPVPAPQETVHAKSGQFLISQGEQLVSVPFSIVCNGVSPAAGVVVGGLDGAFYETTVRCGTEPDKFATQQERNAFALTAEYCTTN